MALHKNLCLVLLFASCWDFSKAQVRSISRHVGNSPNSTSMMMSISMRMSTSMNVISPSRSSPINSSSQANSSHPSLIRSSTMKPQTSQMSPQTSQMSPTHSTPNATQIQPNGTSSVSGNVTHSSTNATIQPSAMSTAGKASMSSHIKPTPKPGKGDNKNMRTRMWIATAFAIIFAVTTLLLGYLVYRQRKINQELAGDPSTSRLL